ncbi:MAG: tetratricopeptide repeat protein [Anaerolineae bacterium]|nr:tetratricopeptide repeat protein [Anaerolineae bacterium]MDK1117304.1 tetratricopeptide repeat protein [Anaerolineae bacterium]
MSPLSTKNDNNETFEERLDGLYEELALALKWERPSILLAIYESENVRRIAESSLEARLEDLGQVVHNYRIDSKNFDVPLALAAHPDRANTVFFVTNLKWGGGKGGYNAFRALNLRRELFVDYQIRMILWLTISESANLPKRAPDFWAFRHGVYEFTGYTEQADTELNKQTLLWNEQVLGVTEDDLEPKISYRENLLSQFPEGNEALMSRAETQYELAYLYWRKGETLMSLKLIESGLKTGEKLIPSLFAKFLIGRGIIQYESGEIEKAVDAFQRAINLQQENATAYANLAIIQHSLDNSEKAITYAEKAVEYSPTATNTWMILGNIYYELGNLEEAKNVFLNAVKFDSKNIKAWNFLGNSYFAQNHSQMAIRAFRKATKIDPFNIEAWLNLSTVYEVLGRIKEAKQTYDKVIELNPSNRQALVFLKNLN